MVSDQIDQQMFYRDKIVIGTVLFKHFSNLIPYRTMLSRKLWNIFMFFFRFYLRSQITL